MIKVKVIAVLVGRWSVVDLLQWLASRSLVVASRGSPPVAGRLPVAACRVAALVAWLFGLSVAAVPG